jgi:hypothetical protein
MSALLLREFRLLCCCMKQSHLFAWTPPRFRPFAILTFACDIVLLSHTRVFFDVQALLLFLSQSYSHLLSPTLQVNTIDALGMYAFLSVSRVGEL